MQIIFQILLICFGMSTTKSFDSVYLEFHAESIFSLESIPTKCRTWQCWWGFNFSKHLTWLWAGSDLPRWDCYVAHCIKKIRNIINMTYTTQRTFVRPSWAYENKKTQSSWWDGDDQWLFWAHLKLSSWKDIIFLFLVALGSVFHFVQ